MSNVKFTEEQEEDKKKTEQEVKRQYEEIISQRKNLFFMQKCTKPCPNEKCNSSISKIDGCNKMLCTRCDTKFCWACDSRLNHLSNPYDHFQNNPNCALFGAVAINTELNETELAALEDETKFKEMLSGAEKEMIDPLDRFMCPTCCCFYIRQRSGLNVIDCIVCKKKLCFMCKKTIGALDSSVEDVKKHFEVSFCYYQDPKKLK